MTVKPLHTMRMGIVLAVATTATHAIVPPTARAQDASAEAPIVYTLRFPAPETHIAEIEARIPTGGDPSIELMMPAWSPGYYAAGNYAENVREFVARTPQGDPLVVDKPADNHWRIETNGAREIVVAYRLSCESRFVTGCWVGNDYAVINGPATFITIAEQAKRPHEVRLQPAPPWKQSVTSLDPAPGGRPHAYAGPDYDTFADSPIVMGDISIHEVQVPGARILLADFGDVGNWNGAEAAETLRLIVDEHRRMMGGLPFERYVFLNAFRGGAGGLEHLNSSLLSSAPNPQAPTASLRWLEFVSHEFFHAINVKRLRPVELGPFDYDHVPRTPSLWISEGLTSYYGDLAVVRSGIATRDDFLAGMSALIRNLQISPGRLVQTLEQASLEVGRGRGSGVGGDRNATVSYYEKGAIVGFLLDATIRRATEDARSLDDVMRLAYARYSGERGFTPDQFQATASEVAGIDLEPFFRLTLATTDELDYSEMLDWFGLRFAEPGSADPARAWTLVIRHDATEAQTRHLHSLLEPST